MARDSPYVLLNTTSVSAGADSDISETLHGTGMPQKSAWRSGDVRNIYSHRGGTGNCEHEWQRSM